MPINAYEIAVDLQTHPPMRSLGETVLGVTFLLFGLIGAVINLPAFVSLGTKPVFVRIGWRYLGLFCLILPKLAHDLYRCQINIRYYFLTEYSRILWLSFCHTLSSYLLYLAATRTYFVHALLLSSIGNTFAGAWKIASRQEYTKIEYIGIAINVFGAYLCCCEGQNLESTQVSPSE